MVIGGDFNLVLDVEKGKKNGIARTHQTALEAVGGGTRCNGKYGIV